MSKKFDPIRLTVTRLEKALVAAQKVEVNTKIGSRNATPEQVDALLSLFKRLSISRLVTAKCGLWYKKMPLVDVVVDFKGIEPRTGEEAGEMAAIMTQTYTLVRQIMATAFPGMTHYTPESKAVEGGWRFQC